MASRREDVGFKTKLLMDSGGQAEGRDSPGEATQRSRERGRSPCLAFCTPLSPPVYYQGIGGE